MPSGDGLSNADVAIRVATTLVTVSPATTFVGTESIALFSASALLVSGWNYKVTAFMAVKSSVAADIALMRIREDTAAGTQDQFGQVYIGSTSGNGFVIYLYAEYTAAATATKTWVVTGQRNGGTGTLQVVAGPTLPAFLTVDRIVS